MTNTICTTTQGDNLLLEGKQHRHEFACVSGGKSYPEIGARLGQVRMAFSDLSRVGWADLHGFNRPQYTHWENGTRRIPIEAAEILCNRYGLTLDFIYRGRLESCSASAIKALSGKPLT